MALADPTTSVGSQPVASKPPTQPLHITSSLKPTPPPRLIEVKPTPPPRPIEDPDDLRRQLDKARDDLARQRSNAKADLERKDQELNEVLQQASEANSSVQRKEQERDDFYKRWKQATSELNKILAQSQSFHQVTDQELVQKTTLIRYNIRNFADQNFVGEIKDAKVLRTFCAYANEYLGVPPEVLERLLKSPSNHAVVVKSYLWAFIAKDIFGKFCWAGTKMSNSLSHLAAVLKPVENVNSVSLEAKRKFQTWKANTTTLLIDTDDEHSTHRRNIDKIVREILQTLRHLSKASERDLDNQIFDIVSEALLIDKLINSQVAEVTWSFHDDLPPTLGSGLKQASDSQTVCLVVAPGMNKRGKSTGADFNTNNVLLGKEVCYKPKPRDGSEGHHGDTTASLINRAKEVLYSRS
ncbi:MAG: hypothetical protein Q9178_000140 [Gyalolechia marmorata]